MVAMSSKHLSFHVESADGQSDLAVRIDRLILAGWTGRDQAAVAAHIEELEALGVAPPPTTPVFYPVSADRLLLDRAIQVSGETTSGEVEYVVLKQGQTLYVGLGSDQTDRELEAHSITLSKQICDKVMADTLWPHAEVSDHWDQLRLRSWALFEDGEQLYQEGTLAEMLGPQDLFDAYLGAPGTLPEGMAMFSGTLPVIGGLRPAAGFRMELHDPVLGRHLAHSYAIEALPVPA